MKLKALSLAIAACTMVSGAYAVAPDAANFKDFPIITAGASAQDKAVISHVVGDLCDSGTIDIYANTAITATAPIGTNDTNVSCNVPNASLDLDNNPATASSQLLFRKLSGGGSINGINAVGNATAPTAQYRALTTANCGAAPTGTIANYLKTGKTVNVWLCGATNEADANLTQPKVGFADVDAGSLVGTSAVPVNLVSKTSFVLTFGAQVTKALRDVLQAAQFGTTGAGALRVGSDKLADMPSLSITDLASLYSGSIKDWNLFTTTSNNTPSFGTLQTVAAQAGLPAPANTRVQIVRRVTGSGTQATLQTLVLGNPCNGGFKLLPSVDNTPATTTSGTGNFVILPAGGAAATHEESSAGNVVLALEALSTANEWAIGFNSLEIGSNNTRYVKVNGAEPTVQQVAGNAYPLWAENIITINSGANNNAAPNYKGFYDGFKAGVALSELNSEFDPRITEVTAAIANNCGVGEQCVGYLNPALATDTSTFTNANPTATATRGLGAAAASMCRPATIVRTAVVEDGTFTTP